MCISVSPAEFGSTIEASFPVAGDQVQLSYMNSVLTRGQARYGVADAGPNAMLYAVPGDADSISVLGCPDPEASRAYLASQSAHYLEELNAYDHNAFRRRIKRGRAVQAGNYLVGIAAGVDGPRGIQATLEDLRQASPVPGNVPTVTPDVLNIMRAYYLVHETEMPSFLVAAFMRDGQEVAKKNPVSVQYTPYEDQERVFLPALDFHGAPYGQQAALDQFVPRDHTLLFETPETRRFARCFLDEGASQPRPADFAQAPSRFLFGLSDKRSLTPASIDTIVAEDPDTPDDEQEAMRHYQAPNSDYRFSGTGILQALQHGRRDMQTREQALFANYGPNLFGRVMREVVGNTVLIDNSNQCPGGAARLHAATRVLFNQ